MFVFKILKAIFVYQFKYTNMKEKIVSRIVRRLNEQGLKSSRGTDYNYHKVYQALNGRVDDDNVTRCKELILREDIQVRRALSSDIFTPMSLLTNKEISLKAKGLYGIIKSECVSGNENLSIEILTELSKESYSAISSGIKELEKHGWISRIHHQDPCGFWKVKYHLSKDSVSHN